MPSAHLQKKLAQAERYVRAGEDNLRRQRQFIAEIERGGHDPSVAKDILALFERLQRVHVIAPDRLIKEVEEADNAPSSHAATEPGAAHGRSQRCQPTPPTRAGSRPEGRTRCD